MLKNVYMIVAVTKDTYAIGKDGDMIYHLKDDLKYFKETTLGHTIVCGKKTYFSFPKRPLPGRKNIILTRSSESFDGASTIGSMDDFIDYANNNPDETIFIVGGDSIYHQFFDLVSKLYITEIDEEEIVEADSFFPKFDKKLWNLDSTSEYVYSDESPRYRYLVYSKKSCE